MPVDPRSADGDNASGVAATAGRDGRVRNAPGEVSLPKPIPHSSRDPPPKIEFDAARPTITHKSNSAARQASFALQPRPACFAALRTTPQPRPTALPALPTDRVTWIPRLLWLRTTPTTVPGGRPPILADAAARPPAAVAITAEVICAQGSIAR